MDVKRYKAGTLKGELTTAEIRKLIRAHNKASSIKISPKSTREDIIGILKKAGYSVNHEKAELRPVSKGKVQKLKVVSQKTIAEELPKPKPLTEEQKKQRQQAKQKKAGEKAFLKASIPKPPPVSKPSKGVKVGKPPPKKSKKEDELRPARKAAPPIPKAKDFVKIGGIPVGQRVDTSGSRNVANVVEAPKKKTEEEKKAESVERKKLGEIRQGINRIRDVKYLQDIIEEWNNTSEGKKVAKSRGQPLRSSDPITKLKEKIIAYEMYNQIKIKIPPKKEKLTEEQKAQKKEEQAVKAKAEREKSKIEKPFRNILNEWYTEFINRKIKGEDGKELADELEDRWEELIEEEKYEDLVDDDEFFEEMENFKDTLKKKLKSTLKEKGQTVKEFAEELRNRKPNK
jgi:hypothetical protein